MVTEPAQYTTNLKFDAMVTSVYFLVVTECLFFSYQNPHNPTVPEAQCIVVVKVLNCHKNMEASP